MNAALTELSVQNQLEVLRVLVKEGVLGNVRGFKLVQLEGLKARGLVSRLERADGKIKWYPTEAGRMVVGLGALKGLKIVERPRAK